MSRCPLLVECQTSVPPILGAGSRRCPAAFCQEIILAEQVEVLPDNRRAVGHRVEKRLAALGIRDLFQLLRQIEIVPTDNAVLDEPLAGFGHLLVFFFCLEEFPRVAH